MQRGKSTLYQYNVHYSYIAINYLHSFTLLRTLTSAPAFTNASTTGVWLLEAA